jgi:hypothetical protein
MIIWPQDLASRIADVCAVISLFLTVILTATAWQVRSRFRQLTFVPQLCIKLETHCTNISAMMGDIAQNRDALLQEVARARGNCMALRRYVPRDARRSIEDVHRKANVFIVSSNDATMRELIVSMYNLLTLMQNLAEDVRYA